MPSALSNVCGCLLPFSLVQAQDRSRLLSFRQIKGIFLTMFVTNISAGETSGAELLQGLTYEIIEVSPVPSYSVKWQFDSF